MSYGGGRRDDFRRDDSRRDDFRRGGGGGGGGGDRFGSRYEPYPRAPKPTAPPPPRQPSNPAVPGQGMGGMMGRARGELKPADDPDFFEPARGTILNDTYRVRGPLGIGTFSRVFEVFDTKELRPYACKVMGPEQVYLQYTCSAKKEAELLKRLTAEDSEGDAGIFQLKDYFIVKDNDREWYCLITEKLDCSVHDFVSANGNYGYEIRTIQAMAKQLLTTLAFLHRRQLTHTDVRHKNILLVSSKHYIVRDRSKFPRQVLRQLEDRRGPPIQEYLQLKDPQVKLIDYGNVTHTIDPHTHPIHTKQFRCPEVFMEEVGHWDEKSDIWCVGCTLYFLYTGQLLFTTHEVGLHLAQMEKICGRMPDMMVKISRRYKSIIHAPPITRWFEPGTMPTTELDAIRPFSETILPQHSAFMDLLKALFTMSPHERPSAEQALEFPFFRTEFPAEVEVDEHCPTATLSEHRDSRF